MSASAVGRPGKYACPRCLAGSCQVIDSRPATLFRQPLKDETKVKRLSTVRRRRTCSQCKLRFSTYEISARQFELFKLFIIAVNRQAKITTDGLTMQDDKTIRALMIRVIASVGALSD